jgi:hypothetical protein
MRPARCDIPFKLTTQGASRKREGVATPMSLSGDGVEVGIEWHCAERTEAEANRMFINMETKKFVIIETSLQYRKLVSIITNFRVGRMIAGRPQQLSMPITEAAYENRSILVRHSRQRRKLWMEHLESCVPLFM